MKMTREEREAWIAARKTPWRQEAGSVPPVDVNTPEGRLRYLRFATEASSFCRAKKPVRFHGENWKL